MSNKKGQLTIMAMITFIIMVFVFAIMLPILNQAISIGTNASNGTVQGATVTLIMNYYPVFIALAILISLWMMVSVMRPQQ